MYIYPDNLRAKPTLWLWQLRDLGVIGVGLLIAVLALTQLRFLPPIVIVALYAFLSIRFDDTSILDFIKNAGAFFLTKPQFYEWGLSVQAEAPAQTVERSMGA
ncbi:MAG: hypothetical protein ABF904_14725 [Ethanoligenens sp.]